VVLGVVEGFVAGAVAVEGAAFVGCTGRGLSGKYFGTMT
jgi:hypothetical protein